MNSKRPARINRHGAPVGRLRLVGRFLIVRHDRLIVRVTRRWTVPAGRRRRPFEGSAGSQLLADPLGVRDFM